MKEFNTADIRNFSIVGHGSSGKTMLSEAMLLCSGSITRLGSIAQGSTTSDYRSEEHKRQISITSSMLHLEWQNQKFNVIDAPGYLDFLTDSLDALRVSDSALVVINATQGVEVGTEIVWEYAERFQLPKVLVVNGLDKEHTDFDDLLGAIRGRFGKKVFPMTIPINSGPGFNQVLDVLRSEIVTYKTDGSGAFEEVPATGEWQDKVTALHGELIEFVAESDDTLLEKFFDQGGLSEEEMRAGIHDAVREETFIPLFCTAAEQNIGVARLMDFIAKFGGTPADRPSAKAKSADGGEVAVNL